MPDSNVTDTPRLQNVEQVSDGWLKKYILTYALSDGSTFPYESVSRKNLEDYRRQLSIQTPIADAVCIVPRTQDGHLVLIREFRYPVNNWCIAFPAGLVEPGEEIATCVERELREETGYALLKHDDETPRIRLLPQASYSSVGMGDESIQMVFADVESTPSLGQQTEERERIEVFTLHEDDVADFLQHCTDAIGIRAQLILDSYARQKR